jgi:hypothetical protein
MNKIKNIIEGIDGKVNSSKECVDLRTGYLKIYDQRKLKRKEK